MGCMDIQVAGLIQVVVLRPVKIITTRIMIFRNLISSNHQLEIHENMIE